MTKIEFCEAQQTLGLDNSSMAKLLGYRRVTTIYEMIIGARKVQPLIENFLTVLLALRAQDRKQVLRHVLGGCKGNLTFQIRKNEG